MVEERRKKFLEIRLIFVKKFKYDIVIVISDYFSLKIVFDGFIKNI